MNILSSHSNIRLYTKSNIIFSGEATATLSLTHQPPTTGSFLRVKVSDGTNNSGTVVMNGTEILTFTTVDWQISGSSYTPTVVITTTGFIDEATKPTIEIQSVDMAGNPITWSTYTEYPCQFWTENPSSFADAMMTAQGLTARTVYRVRMDIENDIPVGTISMGQEFTIEGLSNNLIIWSDPTYHYQLGTDLINYMEFKAVMKK